MLEKDKNSFFPLKSRFAQKKADSPPKSRASKDEKKERKTVKIKILPILKKATPPLPLPPTCNSAYLGEISGKKDAKSGNKKKTRHEQKQKKPKINKKHKKVFFIKKYALSFFVIFSI